MTRVKKNRYLFWLMDMSLKLTRCINFIDVIGMGIRAERIVEEDNKRDIKIRTGLINLSKIMDGKQGAALCQPRNVKNQY